MKTLAEILSSMHWGGAEGVTGYRAYAGEAKSKAGAAESSAQGQVKTALTAQSGNAAAQNSTLGQYEGDLTQSPMYKQLYGLKTQDTTSAYNNARMKRSARARVAGFGSNTPIGQADSATVDQAEASDLGRISGDTMNELMPYQMEAAKLRGGNISAYGNQATEGTKTWGSLEEARKKRTGDMWSKMAGLGLMGASLIPGVGPVAAKTMQSAGASL